MNNCLLTQGRLKPCKNNVGGLKEIYLLYKNNISIIKNNGYITDIQNVNGGPAIVSKFALDNKQSTFTEDKVGIDKLIYFDQNLNVSINRADYITNNDLKKLSLKTDIVVAIHLNTGEGILIGEENGCFLKTNVKNSNDTKSSYSFTIQGKERNSFSFFSGSTYDDIFAGLLTTPVIATTSGYYTIDGNNVITFISYIIQTYSGITLGEGDGFISDNAFFNLNGFLWIDDCVLNEMDFELEYYQTGDGNLYYLPGIPGDSPEPPTPPPSPPPSNDNPDPPSPKSPSPKSPPPQMMKKKDIHATFIDKSKNKFSKVKVNYGIEQIGGPGRIIIGKKKRDVLKKILAETYSDI